MEFDIQAQSGADTAGVLIATTEISGSIDSTIVVGASLSNAISGILYVAESFILAMIVFDHAGYADVVSISVYDLDMQYEGNGVTDNAGFVSLEAPPDGYVVVSKQGYITQKHRYTALDRYVLLQVSLVPIVPVIHTPRGHFVNASPSDVANTVYL